MAANSDQSASISRHGPGRRFTRGTSGNPNGRPKVVFEIRDLAQQHGPAGIAKLAEMAGLAPGTPAEAEAVRVAAIKELLDRAYGKATQPLSGDPTNPINFVIRAPAVVSGTAEWLERYAPKTINGTAEKKTEGDAIDAAPEGPAAEPSPLPAAQPPTDEAWLEANKPKGRDYG